MTDVDVYLSQPTGGGWREHGQVYLSLRSYAIKSLKSMKDTLDEMKTVMGGRCRQWKVLDYKRQQLELYSLHKIEEELSTIESSVRSRGLKRDELRRKSVPIIQKLESLGPRPFFEYLYNVAYSCARILKNDIDFLSKEIERSNRRFDERLKKMLREAYGSLNNFISYVALVDADKQNLDLNNFWDLLKPVHKKVKDLRFRFSLSLENDALENYLGLVRVGRDHYMPFIKSVNARPVASPSGTLRESPLPSVARRVSSQKVNKRMTTVRHEETDDILVL